MALCVRLPANLESITWLIQPFGLSNSSYTLLKNALASIRIDLMQRRERINKMKFNEILEEIKLNNQQPTEIKEEEVIKEDNKITWRFITLPFKSYK